jgi:hypothetical protein
MISAQILPLIAAIFVVVAGTIATLAVALALRGNHRVRTARDLIISYLTARKRTMVSFDRIRERIDQSYTDEFLGQLPSYFPKELRRARLAGGKVGLARVVREDEASPEETGAVRGALDEVQDAIVAQNASSLIALADSEEGSRKEAFLRAVEKTCQQRLVAKPSSPQTLVALGCVLKRLALLPTEEAHRDHLLMLAIEQCTKAIAINPNLETAYYNRACYRTMRGEAVALIVSDIIDT